MDREYKPDYGELEKEVEELQKENEELKKYTRHKDDCRLLNLSFNPQTKPFACSCGLDVIMTERK